jgi:hypothetical protein
MCCEKIQLELLEVSSKLQSSREIIKLLQERLSVDGRDSGDNLGMLTNI